MIESLAWLGMAAVGLYVAIILFAVLVRLWWIVVPAIFIFFIYGQDLVEWASR